MLIVYNPAMTNQLATTDSKTLLDPARQLQVIAVLRYMSDGDTLERACERSGLTIRQYRYALAKDPDIVRRLKELIFTIEAPQLVQIVEARQQIVDSLCRSAATATDPFVLVEIDKRLRDIQVEIESRSGFDDIVPSNDALDMLGGMKTVAMDNKVVISIPENSDVQIGIKKKERYIDASSIDVP